MRWGLPSPLAERSYQTRPSTSWSPRMHECRAEKSCGGGGTYRGGDLSRRRLRPSSCSLSGGGGGGGGGGGDVRGPRACIVACVAMDDRLRVMGCSYALTHRIPMVALRGSKPDLRIT
eukprot:6172951-Pleurochrysis_carterae.AAC.1